MSRSKGTNEYSARAFSALDYFWLLFRVLNRRRVFPDLRLRFGGFDPDAFLADKYDHLPEAWTLVLKVTGIAFGIPLAVLVLGKGLLWVGEGFEDQKRKPN